ncbi:MAG: tetratricopeptide repeat protein [Ktedonobacteraceae bacterium]|nr:tetratricopeptide repeat protein [Ktedonobacteraceae bacterium]
MPSTLNIFCCYARADGELLDKLTTHLMPLQRLGLITIWHDKDIGAGREWEEEINKRLNTAQIILLLISPDFMASEYCYSKEMHRAMQRHEQNEVSVIPIILRPTYWKGAPFEKLQMLPDSARAVTIWPNEDEALYNVTERISNVVNDLIIKTTLSEAKALYDDQNYEGALIIYEQLLKREADLAPAYLGKGKSLLALERYGEGLEAYEEVFRLDPKLADVYFYMEKAEILYLLKRYEESLSACNEVIQCDPLLVQGYVGKADVLLLLDRYREAFEMYEQAIRLKPDEAEYYVQAGDLLLKLRRFEQSIEMYEQAIQLKPGKDEYYDRKGDVLLGLKRFEEALAAL